MSPTSAWWARCADGGRFVARAVRRFVDDDCLGVAASLSFTSLLALVPMAAIGLSVVVAVPFFSDVQAQIQTFIFANLLPDLGERVSQQFSEFVANAEGLGLIGTGALFATILLLLATIEGELNKTFRAPRRRRLWQRLAVYVAVILFGPVMVGTSFTIAGYILAFSRGLGFAALSEPLGRLAVFLPTLLVMVAFTIVYAVVPNRRVRWRDAALGGIVAGLLFSALRWAFAIYVIYMPTYRTLYGALAALPAFLVWIFLSWSAVLFGAVVAALLTERHESARPLTH